MLRSSLPFSAVGIFLLLLIEKPSDICSCQKFDKTAVGARNLFGDSDFENGKIDPWIEQSTFSVKWKIENRNSPWEPGNVAPSPPNGTKYLRVDRGTTLSFGVAVLRSPTFTLTADDQVFFSFNFWVCSKWAQFTNLELYLAKNGNEGLLLNLYEYSNVKNRVWNSKTVSITDDSSSNLTLVFYAYCGTDTEDAVSIDDLLFITQTASTTATSSWTETTTSFFPSSYETESTTFLSITSTTASSSNNFETTDPITSTMSPEITQPSEASTTITTSTTPLIATTSNPTSTIIPEVTTTGEQSTGSTENTDEVTTTVIPTTKVTQGDCPSYLQGDAKVPCWTLGRKCYCFYTNAAGKSWIMADRYCKDEDMVLLSLETVEEDTLIYDHIKATTALNSFNYWTSGRYSLEGNKYWEWSTTEFFEQFNYVNWSPGQPDGNGPGYCAYLDTIKSFSSGYWSDLFCTNSFRFICERLRIN